jgi:hypothetical protein
MTPFFLIAAFLLASSAHAHDCDPLAVSGGVQIGTKSVTIKTDKGSVDAWWCMFTNKDTPPGKVQWRAQYIVDLAECHDAALLAAALGRIALAPSYATVEAEIRAASKSCVVQPGAQRHYDVLRLQWLGCKEIVKPPLVPNFDTPLAADWCGAEPVMPQPTENWRATGGTIYTYSAGKLTGATVRKATAGAVCDPVPMRVVIGATTYMQLVGGSINERTACKQ